MDLHHPSVSVYCTYRALKIPFIFSRKQLYIVFIVDISPIFAIIVFKNVYSQILMKGGMLVAKNSKQTSKRAASAASKVLRDGRTSKASKTAAGSALSQTPSRKTK